MRTVLMMGLAALLAAATAHAELQSVAVGGSLRIRGNLYDWDDAFDDLAFVEQRTRLNVKADFSDQVAAFIEMDSYDRWGEDFRSRYVTGADAAAWTGDDAEVYQAYIEANAMWGVPLRLRAGRQELSFGNEWLIGVNDRSAFFRGLSFDAIRLTYATDLVNVDVLAAKLAETFSDFADDDADLYGVYGTYRGLDDIVIDGYWLFVRDEQAGIGYDVDLHTVGLRGGGNIGRFDFETELARQFGDIEWRLGDYDYDEWGGNLELGYRFEFQCRPRIYVGFAYLGGDSRDLSFNRMFSNVEYSEFLDDTSLSNALVYRAGLSGMASERIELGLDLRYIEADDQLRKGWFLGYWEHGGDDANGFETHLHGTYRYSEDLIFRAGWAHFIAEGGVEEGNLILGNGLLRFVADEDDEYDYLFVESKLTF